VKGKISQMKTGAKEKSRGKAQAKWAVCPIRNIDQGALAVKNKGKQK